MRYRKTQRMLHAIMLLGAIAAGRAPAQESVPLTDSIRSNGIGQIDLLRDVTPATLEALRLANDGEVVLGVDINEAASGTEKAATQGISIKSASLELTYADGTRSIVDAGAWYTESQAWLAESRSTERLPWFTLLGETGSSRISSANSIQDAFDSTLVFPLDHAADALAGQPLVDARVEVILLDTNAGLGDPEAFYDYSAGFEDMALLNAEDRAFLLDYAAGVDQAPAVILTHPPTVVDPMAVTSWLHYPSADGDFLVAYEDRYPDVGDYDWNDLVVAFHARLGTNADGEVVRIEVTAHLVTRGAWFSHDWHLAIGLPPTLTGTVSCRQTTPGGGESDCSAGQATSSTGSLDVVLFSDTDAIFADPGGSRFTNTLLEQAFVAGPRSLMTFVPDKPVALSQVAAPPFDPWLYVRNTGQSVRLTEVDPSAVDPNGLPYAHLMPDSWNPPIEGNDMRGAYPTFGDFATSKGASSTDWYQSAAPGTTKVLPGRAVYSW